MKKPTEADFGWQSRVALIAFLAIFIGGFAAMVRQAHRHIQENSPDAKTKFQQDFPGLDAATVLKPEIKKRVVEQANKEFCACGCGYTVAACLNVDSTCPNRPKNLARVARLIEHARPGRLAEVTP